MGEKNEGAMQICTWANDRFVRTQDETNCIETGTAKCVLGWQKICVIVFQLQSFKSFLISVGPYITVHKCPSIVPRAQQMWNHMLHTIKATPGAKGVPPWSRQDRSRACTHNATRRAQNIQRKTMCRSHCKQKSSTVIGLKNIFQNFQKKSKFLGRQL